MKKYLYTTICLGVIGILFTACGKSKTPDAAQDENTDNFVVKVTTEQFNAMKMEVSPLLTNVFQSTVKANGKIDVPLKSWAKVTSFIGGYVKTNSLVVGDRVSKGQAILTLESPEFIDLQQSYLEIAGQISYLKSEYERQKTLFNEKISSQKSYLQAESQYNTALATYRSLRQKLSMLNVNPDQVEKGSFSSFINVYAPISGNVTTINANVGMAVSPTDVMAEIVNPSDMFLELSVFEKDVFNVKEGQEVEFSVPQIGNRKYKATISQIGKSVVGTDRVINVYATLDEDAKHDLITGMFVDADLITGGRNVLSVPFDAVMTEETSSFLLVLKQKQDSTYIFNKTAIKAGSRSGDWIEIFPTNGIDSTTQVLTKGVYDIL